MCDADFLILIMNNTFPDVSAKQLLGAGAWALQRTISDATDRAKTILSYGEFARQKRSEGNINSSLGSTADGAISVAQNIAGRFSLDEKGQTSEHIHRAFFGENIRRTISAFRVLTRK